MIRNMPWDKRNQLFGVQVLIWAVPLASVVDASDLNLSQTRYDVGDGPRGVALGDLDGDGDLDLVLTNDLGGTVSVLLNNGDGSFLGHLTYSRDPDGGPSVISDSIGIGDLNGDGHLDLAVPNFASENVSVLLNNGDGTFQDQITSHVGRRLQSMAVGDLDGDGDLDLAAVDHSAVLILSNNGGGVFQRGPSFAADSPVSIAIGDLDGDGDLDLATANNVHNNVSVLLNNGDATFRDQVTYDVGDFPVFVAIGDLDGDGALDLAVANFGSRTAADGNISVLLNNGDGTFRDDVVYGVGGTNIFVPLSLAIGDLNGDGYLDLAAASTRFGLVHILANNGDGTFRRADVFSAGDRPFAVAMGDLDGDGDLDLATADFARDQVWVHLNRCICLGGLVASTPSNGSTLPRVSRNCIELEFTQGILPQATEAVVINRLIPDIGLDSINLAASFDIDVSRNVMTIQDQGETLTNETWYYVHNGNGGAGLHPFGVAFFVLFGDMDENRETNRLDGRKILQNRVDPAPRCDRLDLNGDGAVNMADFACFQRCFTRQGTYNCGDGKDPCRRRRHGDCRSRRRSPARERASHRHPP